MKLIRLVVVLCFCSSVVLAETTLEILQQRAEAGDATAQTLMGMMAFYGYQVPKDSETSQEWYQRAAAQGDEFAAQRRAELQKRAPVSESKSPVSRPKEEVEKKIADAASAEYTDDVALEKLLLKRTEYIGKAVKLKIRVSSISMSFEMPYAFVLGQESSVSERLILCGQKSLEWAVKESKRGYGTFSEVYVLVEEKGLIALGTNKDTVDGGCTYSW